MPTSTDTLQPNRARAAAKTNGATTKTNGNAKPKRAASSVPRTPASEPIDWDVVKTELVKQRAAEKAERHARMATKRPVRFVKALGRGAAKLATGVVTTDVRDIVVGTGRGVKATGRAIKGAGHGAVEAVRNPQKD